MITLKRILAVVFLFAMTACKREEILVFPGHKHAGRVDIPLHLIYEPYNRGEVTVYMIIYINGQPVRVAFDTGSSGLRMISGALAGVPLTNYNEAATYGYGNYTSTDQTNISGMVAGAWVSLSRSRPAKFIRFMLINQIGVNGNPAVSYTDSTTFAGAFRHMNGLMGVGMRLEDTTGIASPLAQLTESGQFLVSLPHFRDTIGHLIINPDASDLAGIRTIQLSRGNLLLPNFYNSYNDAALPGSVTINRKLYYGNTLLDCGNPLTWTDSLTTTFTQSYLVPAPQAVRLTVGKEPVIADTTFSVAQGLSGLDEIEVIPVTKANPNKNSFGIQFFLEYDVFYDEAKGLIGVRKKP